ncbi:MAG TPA: hypothetical protein VJN92_07090 [Candidatus Acidoferrum sp.]|nr:hypothetical protein [Candidatus Acidoferrum sp.]
MVTDSMNRVCGVLTGVFLKMKKSKDEGQVFIVGMYPDGKFNLTCVMLGVPGASNSQQMGFLVNALRQQDQEKNYAAVGMALDVRFTEKAIRKNTDVVYVCLEDREGNAEDVIFPYKEKFLGGFKLERPDSRVVEPRVYGPKGDELVALVKDKIKSTIRSAK